MDESDLDVEAVFFHLSELETGDIITVTLEDGSELPYRVTSNAAIPYDDPNILRLMDGTEKDVITLMTRGGVWRWDLEGPYGGNFSHRIVVRAERVLGSQ